MRLKMLGAVSCKEFADFKRARHFLRFLCVLAFGLLSVACSNSGNFQQIPGAFTLSGVDGSNDSALAKSQKLEILIDLSDQSMRVEVAGREKHNWKISSGRSGYKTPTGKYGPTRMHRKYYSRKYNNAPMPNSIFFYKGYAIHGTNAVSALGRPASHGCIRLTTKNSGDLFDLVKAHGRKNTSIRIVS